MDEGKEEEEREEREEEEEGLFKANTVNEEEEEEEEEEGAEEEEEKRGLGLMLKTQFKRKMYVFKCRNNISSRLVKGVNERAFSESFRWSIKARDKKKTW